MNSKNKTPEEKENVAVIDGNREPEESDQVAEVKKHNLTGAVVLGLAIACLLFVIWLIFAIWTTPEDTPPPAEPVVIEDPVEEAPPPPTLEEMAYVEGNDPEILGIRIDSIAGRLFVLPDTGQTLYHNQAGDCTGTCLEKWTPYVATEPIETIGDLLSTFEREDTGELQYTWQGKALYTYNEDTDRSFYGDGHEGTWRIARP